MIKSKHNDFSTHWIKVYPAVSAFVTSQIIDYHSAEDVLSRVATILCQKFDQYDQERPFDLWAIGIARYEVFKYYNEKSRDKLRFSDKIIELISERCCKKSVELNPRQSALQQCLEMINGRAAEALDLRYGDGSRYESIGHQLGMEAGAVRTMLHRVRSTLRQCIDRRLGEGA